MSENAGVYTALKSAVKVDTRVSIFYLRSLLVADLSSPAWLPTVGGRGPCLPGRRLSRYEQMKGSLQCSSNQCFNGLRLTGTIPASNAGGAPDPPAVGSFSVGVVFLGLWLKQKPDCQATVS